MRSRIAAVAVLALATGSASGQEQGLEVFYTKLDPKAEFKYVWQGKGAQSNAGVFRWEVPATEFGTNGLDRAFTGYCAEVLVPITADRLYRFRVNSLFEPANYGLKDHPDAAAAAERRGRAVQELFGRYYRDPLAHDVPADEALALQVALWEVIQEPEPDQGAPRRDLFGGTFRADYERGRAPAFVSRAQQYLDGLTGDDLMYYENPDLRGRELIRLMGVANAEGVVAQSQFALRYAGGGAGGAPLNRALTAGAGAGAGAPGRGAPLAGAPSGGGGGAIPVTNGGGDPPPAEIPGPTIPPAASSPPGGPVTNPPVQPPLNVVDPPVGGPSGPNGPNDPAPIPAPGGLVLGGIALAAIGAWRLRARRRGKDGP